MMMTKRIKMTWLDVVILGVLIAFIAYLGYRVDVVLKYKWAWSRVLPYLLRWDETQHCWVLGLLVEGLLTTIRLACWGILLAAAIGLVFGVCRTARSLFLRLVAGVYVGFVRNIPPLVFIFLFYFFLSNQLIPLLGVSQITHGLTPGESGLLQVLFGKPDLLPNFVTGLLCLAIFEGAYITEIVRAGIQSIPKGQWEGGGSLGLSHFQILRNVILPQALRNVLPPLASQFIMLIKTSSIVSLISIQELTFIANDIASSSFHVFEVWLIAAAMYLMICYSCAASFDRIGKRQSTMDRHRYLNAA
jgi:polar amino acid transport system permease protein